METRCYSRIMPFVGHNPVVTEEASLPDAIKTLWAFAALGAPEPPHNSLRHEIGASEGNETDEAPRVARDRTRWMRIRRIVLAQHRQSKMCRRKLHTMTEGNIYRGKNGDQCRACRNASRRAA